MKGMQKIKHGSGFRGALNYAFFGEKPDKGQTQKRDYDGELIGGNMSGKSPRALAKEFGYGRTLRNDIKKAVWHQSLRLPKDEKLTREQWVEIADDYMKRMGFTDKNQRAYILHDDKDGQHIHIIANRVDFNRKVHDSSHESMKSTGHLQQIERDYKLTLTPGPKFDAETGKVIMPDVATPKKPEIEMALRVGEKPPRMTLQEEIAKALKDGPTMREFVKRLEDKDIKVVPHVASTGTMNGFTFGFNDIHFKGSSLGKSFGWAGLQKGGLNYDKARDTEYLAALRDRAGVKPVNDASADAGIAAGTGKQLEPVFDQSADAGVDAPADAGPVAAIDPAQRIDGQPQPEPRLEPSLARKKLEVSIERDEEPTSRAGGTEQSDGATSGLGTDHVRVPPVVSPDRNSDVRPVSRSAQVAAAIERLPAVDRQPVIERVIERMRELHEQVATPAEDRSLLDRLINKVREFFGLKKPTKENDRGRDGHVQPNAERDSARPKPAAGTRSEPASSARSFLRAGLGINAAGGRAHAEPRHRAGATTDGLPAGQVAFLRDCMQRLSHGDVGASWGHAKSALFENVPRNVDVRRAHGPDGLLGTRGSAPSSAVTPAAPAPIAPPSALVAQTVIEPTKPVEKPKVLDDSERLRLADATRAKEWLLKQQAKPEVPKASSSLAATPAPVHRTGQPSAQTPKVEAPKVAPIAPVVPTGRPAAVEPVAIDDAERRRDDRKVADARRIADKAIATGKGKSDALHKAVDAGDIDSVDRLLDHGAAIKTDTLETAAKSANDAIFKKLVGAGSPQDHNDLRALARECGPAAREKLEALAGQAKAQGGHTTGLGIDGPAGFKTDSDFQSTRSSFSSSPTFTTPKW